MNGYAVPVQAMHSIDTSRVPAMVVQGHRVASGVNGNPRFPGGTLRMQLPYFAAEGFDLRGYHLGTLNVSIAPFTYRMGLAKATFRHLKWHPTEPAEDFSFFDVTALRVGEEPLAGLIYYPHPETKPEHFQSPDVLELLLPWTDGLTYGTPIEIEVPNTQVTFECV